MEKTMKNTTFNPYIHKINRGIASGQITLSNITISNFLPPGITYRPHDSGFLEMISTNGKGDIIADWDIFSEYLTYLKFPLKGKVYGTASGLKSEVAIKINSDNNFIIHQCSAQFTTFDLKLSGSFAANVLHFFRDVIAKALKRRGEEYYCQMVKESLIPWLKTEILRLPEFFEFNYDGKVSVSQSLTHIDITDHFLDLEMNNKIYSSTGSITETISPLPLKSYNNTPIPTRMMEVFISEQTIQEIMTSAHMAGQFKSNFTSPFLRTNCDGLCLGILLPGLKNEVGSTQLRIFVRSTIPPIIRLQNQKALMLLNVSLEIYRNEPFDIENFGNDVTDNVISDITSVFSTSPIDYSVLSINIHCEADLQLRISEKKLRGEVGIRESRAQLKENKFSEMGQQTVDLIVNMSLPFLEDAIYGFLENGLDISEIIKIPSSNEVILIQQGFVHILADLEMYKGI
ncbi:Lipid-binding serum glycoprotein, C-terminal domain and Bactericidal permeability-increasing protein, alpha/beta domain-containing protein [Strongyloides ratti]|uniref:Lipid-binding serum glycoprotein, C-terminal domain and Bactericidal permeability-increasing protein, alpha/beta domain-containing protein n=1 Tax=Strongyloides ratti TaxID=34506 RepID=A0A090LQ27_STRRB|nr:Lipid-binding serum glycoprotein, C-terminal domain and Bactericidal permeability-increasing protein, alpha/beta domain-containing protein [Strongyloides ratti]CEF70249.1 Lipid-binding serum glycoprotein, C-terminal domain and Bactericidal permeability-increasing protein, alpha/beta domain-containing protein [Strongyloides ratti]